MSRLFTGGSSDRLDIGAWNVESDEITLVTWAYAFSFNSSRDDRYISKADGTLTPNHDWMLGKTSTDGSNAVLRARINRSSSTLLGVSTAIPGVNQWYHAAVVARDGGANKDGYLYLNGNQIAFSAGVFGFSGALITNADAIYIGNQPTSTTSAPDGLLADAAVWSRALTAIELYKLAKGQLRPGDIPRGLIYWNPLDNESKGWRDHSLWRRNTQSITGTALDGRAPPYAARLTQHRIYKAPAGGIVAVAADTVSFTDSVLADVSKVAAADDTIAFTDSADAITTRVAEASDTLSLSDSASADVIKVAEASDTVSFTDSAVGEIGSGSITAVAADTISLSDSAEADVIKVAQATDTLSFTDSAEAAVTLVAVASDTIAFTDSATGATELPAVAVDSVSFTDSVTAVVEKIAAAVDGVAFSDSALADTIKVADAVDAVTFTDSAVGTISGFPTAEAVDTVVFGDSAVAVVLRATPTTPPSGGGGGKKRQLSWQRAPAPRLPALVVDVPPMRQEDNLTFMLTAAALVLAIEDELESIDG